MNYWKSLKKLSNSASKQDTHASSTNCFQGIERFVLNFNVFDIVFYIYFFFSLDVYGFIGQLLTDSLNSSVYTYEVAPVFTLVEKTVLKTMRLLVGWETGDGIFCPGGSIANGIGINIARFNYDNNIKVFCIKLLRYFVYY